MYNLSRYNNCISLGWFCGTAAAMSYYGLRSHASPFDWCFSNFESVIKVIENNFFDFMKKENLRENGNNFFLDMKYGFRYPHDVDYNFNLEYPNIYKKYMRRVEYFKCSIKTPTCFIRTVKSAEEIKFIKEKRKYIYEVIKKENPDNEIIFLLLFNMQELPDDFLWFRLGINEYDTDSYKMRVMFDSSIIFSEFCRTEILSSDNIMRNKKFDIRNMKMRDTVFHLLFNVGEEELMSIFKKYYYNLDKEGIYLWGAGYYGKLVLDLFFKAGIKVNGIIDNDISKFGILYKGIKIIPFSDLKQDDQNIFIAVSAEEKIEEIEKQIIKSVFANISNLIEMCEYYKTKLIN